MQCLGWRGRAMAALAGWGIFALVLPVWALTPDDPLFPQQWYLRQIGAPAAWDVTTGSPDVVVAVLDAGVDERHPDLRGAIWTNTREIPANGIDDDRNGYIDDLNGWNFVNGSFDTRPLRTSDQLEETLGHGTIVASIIAGRGDDGQGMAGVAWGVKIMPLVVLNADGNGAVRHIAEAIRYAVRNGADVINLSLVGYEADDELDRALFDAWKSGVFVAVAAGNDFASPYGTDLERMPLYPACSLPGSPAVVTVTATDALDQKVPSANFGRTCVTLAAPGFEFVAAFPVENGAATSAPFITGITGTSAAVPLVSGAAALLKSRHPQWRPSQIRARLVETAQPIEDLQRTAVRGGMGFGRLDLARALREPAPFTSVRPGFMMSILSSLFGL